MRDDRKFEVVRRVDVVEVIIQSLIRKWKRRLEFVAALLLRAAAVLVHLALISGSGVHVEARLDLLICVARAEGYEVVGDGVHVEEVEERLLRNLLLRQRLAPLYVHLISMEQFHQPDERLLLLQDRLGQILRVGVGLARDVFLQGVGGNAPLYRTLISLNSRDFQFSDFLF